MEKAKKIFFIDKERGKPAKALFNDQEKYNKALNSCFKAEKEGKIDLVYYGNVDTEKEQAYAEGLISAETMQEE